MPRQNGGEYTSSYQGILVLCSEQGIVSGACVVVDRETTCSTREDGCTRFAMVARTDDGREIDHQQAPICRDEEWRIGG